MASQSDTAMPQAPLDGPDDQIGHFVRDNIDLGTFMGDDGNEVRVTQVGHITMEFPSHVAVGVPPTRTVQSRAAAARINPLAGSTLVHVSADTGLSRQNIRQHMTVRTRDEAVRRMSSATMSNISTIDEQVAAMLTLGLPSAYIEVSVRGAVDRQFFVSLVRESANGGSDGRHAFITNRYLSTTSHPQENCRLSGGDRDFLLDVTSYGPDEEIWLTPIMAAVRCGCDVRLAVTITSVSAGRSDGRVNVTVSAMNCQYRTGPNGLVPVCDVGNNGLETTMSNAVSPWLDPRSHGLTRGSDFSWACVTSLSYFHKQLLAMSAALRFQQSGSVVTDKVTALMTAAHVMYRGAKFSDMTDADKKLYLINIVNCIALTDDWTDLVRVTEDDSISAWLDSDNFVLVTVLVSPLLAWRFGIKNMPDEVTHDYLHSAMLPPMTSTMSKIDHPIVSEVTREHATAEIIYKVLDHCLTVGLTRTAVLNIVKVLGPGFDPVVQSVVRALSTTRAIIADNHDNSCLVKDIAQAHAFVTKHEFNDRDVRSCRQYQLPRHVLTCCDPRTARVMEGRNGAVTAINALKSFKNTLTPLLSIVENGPRLLTVMQTPGTGVMEAAKNVWDALTPDEYGKHHLTDAMIDALTIPGDFLSVGDPTLVRLHNAESDLWRMSVAVTLLNWAGHHGSETVSDFVKYG